MYKKIFLGMTSLLLLTGCASHANEPAATPPAGEQVFCTMDVRQCPDGSWAGRSGPKCEFKCPGGPETKAQ